MPDHLIPATVMYTFRASVLLGSEIPIYRYPSMEGAAKMKVVIDFAGNRLEFSFRSNIRGQVTWLETKDAKDIELPKDLAQMPDVGVYLVRDGIGQSKKVHSGWAGTNNKKKSILVNFV